MTTAEGGPPVRDFDVVLVLSGGNALGAFQAGVYQALHEHGLAPDWIVGASVGAINGAMIVGSAPERRIATLREFWRPDGFDMGLSGAPWFTSTIEVGRRTAAAAWTMISGRPGVFGPLMSSMMPWTDTKPSIFETDQLDATLKRLVDFDGLNAGPCRLTVTAVDLGDGEDVVFDTDDHRLEAFHIRASAALPVAFPAVEIDGRWLADGGLSANLPLDPVLAAPSSRPTLCLAVDLLPLSQPLPKTLGEAASRMQDLIFAAQSRRSIARWQAVHAGRDDISLSLVRLAYTEQDNEVAGKALDFSGPTIEHRWSAGYRSGMRAVRGADAQSLKIGQPGLNVVNPDAA
jgi:NTE family protein